MKQGRFPGRWRPPAWAWVLAWAWRAWAAGLDPAGLEYFEARVRPLLLEHCTECHGATEARGGLRLDRPAGWITGGRRGPAVVPGRPEASLLLRAVRHEEPDLRMPGQDPGRRLPEAKVAVLEEWIRRGAPAPDATASPSTSPALGPAESVVARARKWWAFQPLARPALPAAGAETPIDAFLDAALGAAGLTASPVADRRTWIRRVSLALTGLPPSPDAVEAFERDSSPGAWGAVVERLLASPAYGEHWARQWLDVVRYADYHDGDPQARTASCEPLEAWRYRDWVVGAFNRDLPFDRFITQQIAGDLPPVPGAGEAGWEGMIATGFLVNGSWDRGDADKEKLVSDMVDDQIDTVGKAFLGLTLGCARCHDHKFDPVSIEDYYGLAGIFYSTRILEELGTKGGEVTLKRVPMASRGAVAARERQVLQVEALRAKLAALDKLQPPLATHHPARVALLRDRAEAEAALPPAPPMLLTAAEGGMPGGLFPNLQDVPVHGRGSYTKLGPVVPRRMPEFFAGRRQPPIRGESGRRELAAWVASATNPLTARVIVNRVWQGHFGAGLVATPNNFGLSSEPPTHPALLDWLAAQFIADGWSLKALHRRIAASAAYRRSASARRAMVERDPANRWLARFPARRLPAEAIRDSLLWVAGGLDAGAGGPAGPDLGSPRRSLYVQTARWDRGTFAALFDAANPDASVERRDVSTVAPQALFLVNHGFVREQARALAERAAREAGPGTGARVAWLHRVLYARPPRPEEVAAAGRLIDALGGAGYGSAWRDYAHVLLCTNEFIYLE